MRRTVSWLLAMILSFSMIDMSMGTQTAQAADGLFRWNKRDTLDTNLQVISNKAGTDDVLLQLNLVEAGAYELQYFLEDGKRTTVKFTQQYSELAVEYKVEQMVSGVPTNVTQSLVNIAYLEMDYQATVPDWVYVANKKVDPITGALKFSIPKNASTQYRGFAFQIADKKIYASWDFQSDQLLYQIIGYKAGTIMPVTMTTPIGDTQTTKILKGLENYIVRPTHFVNDGLGGNKEIAPLTSPGGDKPGSRPGIEISFKQPKELNNADWVYYSAGTDFTGLKAVLEFDDIASSDYLDFNFTLNNSGGTGSKVINELPDPSGVNGGVVYKFDTVTQTYTIEMVMDKSPLAPATFNQFIEWSSLKASKIYNTSIGFQKESGFEDYEFDSYLPQSKFAYTYMEFDIGRSNMAEAYLNILPYDADSEQEVEYTILYSKVITTDLDAKNDLWVKHYYRKSSLTEKLFIPVPFNKNSSQDVYQIIINFAGVPLKSQVLNYRAKDDLNVPPTTPRIDAIDNLYVVPNDKDVSITADPLKAQFDLVWTAPENRTSLELDTIFKNTDGDLSNDRIFYEVLANDVPIESTTNPFNVIKVFEVYKDAEGYKLKKYDGVTGNETPQDILNYKDGYSIQDELFRMNDIEVFSNNQWAPIIQTVADEETGEYSILQTTTPYNFEFPGVNYLRLRAITMMDGEIGVSYLSVPMSLTLSVLKYDVPITEGLAYQPLPLNSAADPIGINLDWQGVDVSTYEEHMLIPVNRKIDDLYYSVYISQDPNKISNLGQTVIPTTNVPMDGASHVTIDATTLNQLRNNDVINFDMLSDKDILTKQSVDIAGLDKNTNYYIRIVTRLDMSYEDDSDPIIRRSEPSSILSITTPVIPQEPDEGEVTPVAVENFVVDYANQTTKIGALLSWDFPSEIQFKEDGYAFEIMSIEDVSLPDGLSGSGLMLEDLQESTEMNAMSYNMWEMYVEDGTNHLLKYNRTTGFWDEQDSSTFTVDGQHAEMVDNDTTPNRVYYYYVRVINVVGGNINSASPWRLDSLTTAPVKGPINLAVSYNSGVTYNPKQEIIVRMDAPIPDANSLINDYRMEIFVKGEADADYTNTKYTVTYLKQGNDGALGYTRLYYKISGLESGKAYSIKARIEDRTAQMETLPDGSRAYPRSPFSERIIVRTEFDQGDYDKGIKYQEYLDYFDMKVKEFAKQDYFVLESTATKQSIKYRDSMASGTLQINKNNAYNLNMADVKTNVFYLPAKFVENANKNNVTLSFVGNGENLQIRPFSMGVTLTPEIMEKANAIKQYQPPFLDYYVRITVEASPYTSKINMKTPASDLLTIKMEVVGSKKVEDEIDALMVKELDKVAAWRRNLLETTLSLELDKGINDAKLLTLAQNAVTAAGVDYRFANNTILLNSTESQGTTVAKVAKNMFISITPTGPSVNLVAVKNIKGTWQDQYATNSNGKYNIESPELTNYILLPIELYPVDLGGIYTQPELDMIQKYALYDIFNSSELSRTDVYLDKYRMIPAFARILGAPKGSDNIDYLVGQGIDINGNNLYGSLYREEILYVYTQVFAKKHGIDLNSGKITDYNMISDYSAISAPYQQKLLIGANLKMVDLINGALQPKSKMTIQQYIKTLTKLDQGLNW